MTMINGDSVKTVEQGDSKAGDYTRRPDADTTVVINQLEILRKQSANFGSRNDALWLKGAIDKINALYTLSNENARKAEQFDGLDRDFDGTMKELENVREQRDAYRKSVESGHGSINLLINNNNKLQDDLRKMQDKEALDKLNASLDNKRLKELEQQTYRQADEIHDLQDQVMRLTRENEVKMGVISNLSSVLDKSI